METLDQINATQGLLHAYFDYLEQKGGEMSIEGFIQFLRNMLENIKREN